VPYDVFQIQRQTDLTREQQQQEVPVARGHVYQPWTVPFNKVHKYGLS
jgi:hypothetical protein